jgi:hypothetical protein
MNPQEQIKLIGPSELLSKSWSFFKKNWKTLIGITATPFLGVVIAVVFFILAERSHSIVLGILGGVFYVVMLIFAMILYPTLISAIHALSTGSATDINIIKQYKSSFGFFWSFVLLMIILILATYGSFALFIIPGIVISVYVLFSIFTFTVDGKRGIASMVESFRLVQGYWWQVFGRMLFLALIFIGLGILLEIIIFILALVGSHIVPSVILAICAPIILFVFDICAASLSTVYTYNLYKSLKEVKTNVTTDVAYIKPWFITFIIIGVFAIIGYIMLMITFSSVLSNH